MPASGETVTGGSFARHGGGKGANAAVAAARSGAAVLAARPILTPNAAEASALTGEGSPERAAPVLRELSGAPVLVTLGARGALLLDEHGARVIPAPRTNAVDTTGAGDVFAGAMA